MAHALETPDESQILRDNPLLTFKDGKYSYRIERQQDQSIYSVSDGETTVTAPVRWAIGMGHAGQTYIFENAGGMYESRVSYYLETGGLDLTIGARNMAPQDITQAAGRLMNSDDQLRCLGCHSTSSAAGRVLTFEKLTPGVQCERCHGETEAHVAAVKRGDTNAAPPMPRLSKLSTEEVSNFCGQCHRTWEDIAASGTLGIQNVRFQPYRLTNSKCYDSEDARISCLACHDPHSEIKRVDASYDSRCQTCHGGGKPKAVACRVAKANCVSCHMPKIEIPGTHHKFTDHQIRIVRANAEYPN